MNRILYDVPRWSIYLHRRARRLWLPHKNDQPPVRFDDEVFERLFRGNAAPLPEAEQDKQNAEDAKGGHQYYEKIIEETGIAAHTRDDVQKAMLATAWLREIKPPPGGLEEMPEGPPEEGDEDPDKDGLHGHDPGEQERQAEEKRDDAEAESGLEDVSVDKDNKVSGNKAEAVRQIAEALKDDERLRKIGILAAKMKRIMMSKQRMKATAEADEFGDIELGGDLARLIPSELMKFRHPKLRKVVMRDLAEKKCLQWAVIAVEKKERGPILFCVSKAATMSGDKDIWANALSLALLDMAHRQRRAFLELGFNQKVFHVLPIRPGRPMLLEGLTVPFFGPTKVFPVLQRAMDAIDNVQKGVTADGRKTESMERLDVVLIADEGSDIAKAPEVRQWAETHDVRITGIGLGQGGGALKPWCGEHHVTDALDTVEDDVANALFGK